MPEEKRRNTRKTHHQQQAEPDSKGRKPLKNPAKVISSRVNILFFVIFVLFMILIGRLYSMQVLNKHYYVEKGAGVAATVPDIVQAAPRGNIYDATGTPLATTTAVGALEFTRGQNTTAAQMRQIADKLSTMVAGETVNTTLTTRDKKDYYLADAANLKKIADSLTDKETKDSNGNDLSGADIYKVELSKVTDADLDFTEQQLFAAKLFKKMNGTSTYSTTIIASNLNAQQQAVVGEQEGSLPGISLGSSYSRSYAQNSLTSLLGNVGAIPAEKLDTYLKEGYQQNSQVGIGFLEQGYENELKGTNQISKVELDKSGNVTGTKVTQQSQQGDSLKLTINMGFQEGVDNIVQAQLNQLVASGNGDHTTGAYAVVLDVKTGAILALSGYSRNTTTGVVKDDTLGTFQSSFTPGSVVKMGTLTAAWQAGVISGNAVQTAQKMNFAGTTIPDWWGDGVPMALNAVQALQYSSNTYMAQLALKLLGQPYYPNMQYLSTENRVKAWDELRAAYASYGLGVSTGLDIPGESTGIVNPTSFYNQSENTGTTVANAIYESFGQYDTYTPLQLGVYAATIANNGKRLSPHIVQGIYDTSANGGLGTEVKSITPKLMDEVNITPDNMAILHQGMYNVVHGTDGYTTGKKMAQGTNVSISAKTGTSQREIQLANGSWETLTVKNTVAYAPSDSPQIAIAVMIPDVNEKDVLNGPSENQDIVTQITNLYYSKPEYQSEN